MMYGIPVLITDVSDNGLYIQDFKNGFIVKPGNKALLERKLEEILAVDSKKLIEIGLAGRKTAVEYFNNMKYSDKLYQFLFKSNISGINL